MSFNFGHIPLLGIPITILALPMLFFILGGSLATAIAGIIHPALGQVVGVTAWVPLSYLPGLVSNSPGPTVSGAWNSAPLVWSWYLALGLLLLAPRGWKCLNQLPQSLKIVAIGEADNPKLVGAGQLRPSGLTFTIIGVGLMLVVANVLLWGQLLSQPDCNLEVYFLDVGQGDSTFFVTPYGRQVLIDGGPTSESATIGCPTPCHPGTAAWTWSH